LENFDECLNYIPDFCLIDIIALFVFQVEVFVNKIGPYFNKHETYHFYQLPLCRPVMVLIFFQSSEFENVITYKSLSLGQLLNGDRIAESSYSLHFGERLAKASLCGKYKITVKELADLVAAVEDNFYFELIIGKNLCALQVFVILDNIRVHNYLGFVEEQNTFPHKHHAYLYTHFVFAIDYSLRTGKVCINCRKFERQNSSDKEFFAARAERVQWTAILNSSLLILFLVFLFAWILHSSIKSELNRHNDKVIDDFLSEKGWKSISTDVFRLPKYRTFFASIIGVGSQFLFLVTVILIIGSTNLINAKNHETLNSAAVFLYAVTSGIAGFVSSYIYRQFGGEHWALNANITTCLFTVPMTLIWVLNNSVSWMYGSTQALPYTTIMILGLLWLCVGYPLTVIGAAIAKNIAAAYSAPCRTRNIPRQLPDLPFYKTNFVLIPFGGLLSFSSVSAELFYIFSTIWSRELYTVYYVLLIALLMLIIVVATSSIMLIYIKLNAENYHWWWSSIFIGGSVAVFIFIYGTFFYYYRSSMTGLLQRTEYFSHLFLLCYIFFLTMGTVSFLASHWFIRLIYSSVKYD
uniref:Transmembrane 9 superfamily member n=1 Tax=Thelazia callipaeda TaxID=103827 RepID=A0A0N5CUB9_THECL